MWKREAFLKVPIGDGTELRKVSGHTYKGLGMRCVVDASPKGRRPPKYEITHLGSGHVVAFISGFSDDAFQAATELADAADWSFEGLKGWVNSDPEIKTKFIAWMEKHKKIVTRAGLPSNDSAAKAVAMARA